MVGHRSQRENNFLQVLSVFEENQLLKVLYSHS